MTKLQDNHNVKELKFSNFKNTNKLLDSFERQFEGKFISKPNDVFWLDREEQQYRIRFARTDITCVYCKKEIKVLYRYSMIDILHERLEGKLCPNCGYSGLRMMF